MTNVQRGRYLETITVDGAFIGIPVGTAGWPLILEVYASPTSAAMSRVDPAGGGIPRNLQTGYSFTFLVLALDSLGNPQRYAPGIYEGAPNAGS